MVTLLATTTTAAAAIAANAEIKVAYNSTIDLREYVNTDRKSEDATGCVAWDKNAAAGTVEKVGFKYKFELVGYEDGTNHTKQSVHAAIASDGYTLRPQMPKDGKQQAYGAEQNQATIDKEPLVRVSLIDTKNSNQVVAVGYFKVKISSVEDVVENPTIAMPEENKAYTLTCGDNAYMTQLLKWNTIEEEILAELNVSKADFHNNYTLEGTTSDATQFDAEGNVASKIGVISQTTADVDGTQTQVLQWVVKNQEAYSAFKSGKTSLVTYVCYKHNTDAKKKVYLKFTWNPKGQINIAPSTSYGNDNKTVKYWYGPNKVKAGTGFNEIHGNVEVVGSSNNDINGAVTAAANDEFVFNIKNTLVGNELAVTGFNSTYAGLNNQLTLTFAFADGHGLYANTAGTKIYAEQSLTNLVATLDPVKGIVTMNKNAEALKLLNAHGHTSEAELYSCLTAKIKVVAKVCSSIDVPVSDNEFDVKFIRPITVSDATATFTDAAQSVQNLSLTFKDWRGMGFTASNRIPNSDYFTYYGVKKITLNTAEATTDLNGNSSHKLSDVTSKIKIKYNGPANNGTQITAGNYGQIVYENLGNTVGTFHIEIPGTVTYDWGELPITVKVTVNATASAKRH